jgi:hypothetical protein
VRSGRTGTAVKPGDRVDDGRAIRGRLPVALSAGVRPISGTRPPSLPGTSRTTSRTTPVAIVSVMADVLGRTQVPHCASVAARGDRDGQPISRSRCGLASEVPVCAARCRAPAKPARRLPESSPSDVPVAKTLAGATWPVARGLATGLPAGGRACRGGPSPDADAVPGGQPDHEDFTKVVGLGEHSGKRFGKRPRAGCPPTPTCSGGGAVMTTRGAAAALFGDGGPRCSRW